MPALQIHVNLPVIGAGVAAAGWAAAPAARTMKLLLRQVLQVRHLLPAAAAGASPPLTQPPWVPRLPAPAPATAGEAELLALRQWAAVGSSDQPCCSGTGGRAGAGVAGGGVEAEGSGQWEMVGECDRWWLMEGRSTAPGKDCEAAEADTHGDWIVFSTSKYPASVRPH